MLADRLRALGHQLEIGLRDLACVVDLGVALFVQPAREPVGLRGRGPLHPADPSDRTVRARLEHRRPRCQALLLLSTDRRARTPARARRAPRSTAGHDAHRSRRARPPRYGDRRRSSRRAPRPAATARDRGHARRPLRGSVIVVPAPARCGHGLRLTGEQDEQPGAGDREPLLECAPGDRHRRREDRRREAREREQRRPRQMARGRSRRSPRRAPLLRARAARRAHCPAARGGSARQTGSAARSPLVTFTVARVVLVSVLPGSRAGGAGLGSSLRRVRRVGFALTTVLLPRGWGDRRIGVA